MRIPPPLKRRTKTVYLVCWFDNDYNYNRLFFVETLVWFAIVILTLFLFILHGRNYFPPKNILTSYHINYQNIYFSDSFIRDSIFSWRTSIARRESCQSSAYYCRTEIQKLRSNYSNGDDSKYCYLTQRTSFLTVHYFPCLHDASDMAQ